MKNKKRPHIRPTIGFLTHGLWDTFGMFLWHGVMEAAIEEDVNFLCFPGGDLRSSRNTPDAQANVLYDLVSPENVDGLVLSGGPLSSFVGLEGFQMFCDQYRPLPMASIAVALNGIPGVLVDNYQGVRETMIHLIEVHGCRRVAFIPGPADYPEAVIRYQAYLDLLQEYAIPFDPDLVTLPGCWDNASGRQAITLLLDQRHVRFEAVVAANDGMAIGAWEALQARGINVPDDVIVTGFNDSEDVQVMTPPFTTVRQPSYEQARQAAQLVVAQLRGERVPEQVILPTQLVVRQSCGCLEPHVTQMVIEPVTTAGEPFPAAFAARQARVLQDMAQVVGAGSGCTRAPEWAVHLIEAFVGEITLQSPGTFLNAFNKGLRQVITAHRNVTDSYDILSVLRRHALPCLNDAERSQAEDLWQQARLLIEAAAKRMEMFQAWQQKQQAQTLREIESALISTFDIQGLREMLVTELPRLGIPSCYLALYANPAQPTAMAKLILAHNDQQPIELPAGDCYFSARQLVPADLLPHDRRYSFVVEPLYFRTEQIGVALFEVGPHDGTVYEGLRSEISSALYGALLVQRIQAHTAEITRQKYILDTFMANVPDSIYFKDRESRITQANSAHARVMGFSDPAEEVGKSDFDFFPDEQARPKYEQEQEIMRTGQPLLALEEPDAGGRWALTTKMPLQDEHGAIIGTFGISRDITPLKQAQLEVAAAYEEIKILNYQLKDENLQMHAEMDLARRIQTALLPPMVKHLHPDFEIAAVMLPAEEVGGDYYDITLDREGTLWIGIGDVSGHGVTPGLIMMMAQTAHTTITSNYQANARDIVISINNVLFRNVRGRLGEDHFMTFTTLKYLGAGRFQYAGAHLDFIIYRDQTNTCELLDTPGTWLDFIPNIEDITWDSEFSLNIGDVLVLYTDGLTEAFSPQGELLDIQRLVDIVTRHAKKEVELLRDAIIADVMEWCQKKQKDDMSLVVMRRIC